MTLNRKYKIFWIHNLDNSSHQFHIPVKDSMEGALVLNLLANYDLYLHKDEDQPDFSNTGGLMFRDSEEDEWEDWYDPDEGYFDLVQYFEDVHGVEFSAPTRGLE